VASFIAGLGARGVRVSDADGARKLTANVVANGSDGFVGTVSVGDGGAERHVRGHVCSEVVSALAFVASLEVEALERQAAAAANPTGVPQDGAAKDAPKDGAPNDGGASDGAPKDNPPKDPTPKDNAPKDAGVRDTTPKASASSSIVDSFDLGADAAVVAGPLPSAAFAVPLFIEAGFGSPSAAPLHVRLRFQQVGTETTGAGYTAQFTLTTGSVELAGRVLDAGRLHAFVGIRADAGSLAASGGAVTPALSSSRPWFTIGPEVRGRVVVAGPFFAELDLGLPFAATRDRFFVEPDTTVHKPGVVGAVGALGLGFSLF